MRKLVAVTFLLLFATIATALSLQSALDPVSKVSGCPVLKSRNAVSAEDPACPYMQRGRCPYTHPRTALPQAAGRPRFLEI